MLRMVVQVKPTKDFKVYVYFSDGKIKLYDMTPVLNQGVFKQISDIDTFTDKCTVINNTLAWDIGGNFDEFKCLDIDPEMIYASGVDVADPLSEQIESA
jgi:hypothetical protein